MLTRSYKTEGIIIRRRNVGEADKILTIYTKVFGKISVKAIGVRKITSRRAASIEPFNLVYLSLHKGRGIPILTEIETIDTFSSLREDLTKVGLAYHLCELIDGLNPENQENEQIFFLLKDTLLKLAKEKEQFPIIHQFEIELLTTLGYWPKNKTAKNLDTQYIIENILEKRLKAKQILKKLD